MLDDEVVTIHIGRMNKSFGWRKGQYLAWVEGCGEDEFGFASMATTPEMALWRLSHDFSRVIGVCRRDPELIDTAYEKGGWAYGETTPGSYELQKAQKEE